MSCKDNEKMPRRLCLVSFFTSLPLIIRLESGSEPSIIGLRIRFRPTVCGFACGLWRAVVLLARP